MSVLQLQWCRKTFVCGAWPASKSCYHPGWQNKQGGSFPQKNNIHTKVISNSTPLGTVSSETKRTIVAIHCYIVVMKPPLQKNTKDSSGQPQSLDHDITSRVQQRNSSSCTLMLMTKHTHMHVHTLMCMQTHILYLAMEQLVQQIQTIQNEQHYANKTNKWKWRCVNLLH